MKMPSGDHAINLDASTSRELKRVVAPQPDLPLQDSAVIPNIEAWLKGRCQTDRREVLQNEFKDTSFR
jgi:hypothetical protein